MNANGVKKGKGKDVELEVEALKGIVKAILANEWLTEQIVKGWMDANELEATPVGYLDDLMEALKARKKKLQEGGGPKGAPGERAY